MKVFKDGFVWGVATASYQIEGAHDVDGRKPSVWDMFCRKPRAVFEGHTGDVACDHYYRYNEDVALMRELGVNAYRFSIAWPRAIPDGTGKANAAGVAFYDRLVDALLEAGIEPWATLYHWDLPLDLYHRGGWLNREIVDWFGDYTQVVVDALSDRVGNWMTLNEPQVFIGLGYHAGIHAPGDKLRWAEVLLAMHNSHLAHGKASQVIRARTKRPCRVGIAPAVGPAIPNTTGEADLEAARKANFRVDSRMPWHMAWWLDPLFFGTYPEDGLAAYGEDMPEIRGGDMALASQPIDFLGMNIYRGPRVQAGPNGEPTVLPDPVGGPRNAIKWPITPECLYWGPKLFHERYGVPIVITENGMSGLDSVSVDGKVHDPQRIDYTHRHLRELQRAAGDGVPVDGYFHWSFMDNFEWGEGYKERFGLVFVDYATQQRIPKDSFAWYQNVIRQGGVD